MARQGTSKRPPASAPEPRRPVFPIPGPVGSRVQAVGALLLALLAVAATSGASLLASLVAGLTGWQALRGLSLHECTSPWRYAAWTAITLGALGTVAGLGSLLLA